MNYNERVNIRESELLMGASPQTADEDEGKELRKIQNTQVRKNRAIQRELFNLGLVMLCIMLQVFTLLSLLFLICKWDQLVEDNLLREVTLCQVEQSSSSTSTHLWRVVYTGELPYCQESKKLFEKVHGMADKASESFKSVELDDGLEAWKGLLEHETIFESPKQGEKDEQQDHQVDNLVVHGTSVRAGFGGPWIRRRL